MYQLRQPLEAQLEDEREARAVALQERAEAKLR